MSIVLPAVSALGTTWLVELFDEMTKETADETHGLIRCFLSDFEENYSRFNPNSIISTVNCTKILKNPDPTTLEIIKLGQQFYQDTNSVFNFLVGEHLIARGYDTDYSFTPKTEPDYFPNPLTDLIVTKKEIILKRGLIDLGGYGKGYLIDRLTEQLHKLGLQHFLVNGGGDIYATSDHGEPIIIYLEHPTNPGTYISQTALKNQGFAASSTHKRRWRASEKEYSHIVDTTTDKHFARDDFGIYVKAPTAVVADVWSTTLLITEPDDCLSSINQFNINFARFDSKKNTLVTSSHFSK